jgi:hypothetical protein
MSDFACSRAQGLTCELVKPDAELRHGFLGLTTGIASSGPSSSTFLATPGQCAVCYRSFAAASEEALEASGWKISGELGLCPLCQEDAT